MEAMQTETNLDAVFKALASKQRREILELLSVSTPEPGKTCCADDEMCACKITEHLELSASTISHHMSILCKAGLVSARKDGLWTYYTLTHDALEQAAKELRSL